LYQFTGLEELILFGEPGFGKIYTTVFPRVPANNGMIKYRVAWLTKKYFNRLVEANPEWQRPVVNVWMDERSLRKKLK
jgi:hypothetical protein